MATRAVPMWAVDVQPGWKLTVAGTEMSDAPARVYETDRELARACVDKTPGAFDVLVERHRRIVYQLCYRFVGNHEDARGPSPAAATSSSAIAVLHSVPDTP